MNVAFDSAYDFGDIEVLHVYACRVARKLLLGQRGLEAGHPVLTIEEDLIEMAKARLQEFLLGSFREDPAIVRLSAIVAVKRVAASKIIAASDIDNVAKQDLLRQLSFMPMEDLIPQVH
jgi:hypothetical protein